MGWLSALIGAAGAAASAGISAGATSSMNKNTRKFNERMWHMANDYNLPVNQYARMRDAGISPTAAAAGIAGANYQPEFLTAPDVSGEFGSSIQRGIGQMADVFANADLKRAQAENLDANTENVNEDTKGKEIENAYKPQLNEATLNKLVKDGDVSGYLADMYKSDAAFRDSMNHANLDQIEALSNKYRKEYSLLEQDIKNKEQEIKESIARISKMNSEEAVNYSQAKKNRYDARVSKLEGDLKVLEKRRENIRTEVYERIHVDPASQPVLSAYLDSDNPDDFLDGVGQLKEAEESWRWNTPTDGGFGIPAVFEKTFHRNHKVFGTNGRGYYGVHHTPHYRSLKDAWNSIRN